MLLLGIYDGDDDGGGGGSSFGGHGLLTHRCPVYHVMLSYLLHLTIL